MKFTVTKRAEGEEPKAENRHRYIVTKRSEPIEIDAVSGAAPHVNAFGMNAAPRLLDEGVLPRPGDDSAADLLTTGLWKSAREDAGGMGAVWGRPGNNAYRLNAAADAARTRADSLTEERRDILGFNPAPTQEQRDRVAEIDREREALRQRSGQLREDARWAEYGQLRYRPDFYANSTRPRSTLDDTRRRAGGEAVDERYLVGLEHAGGVGSMEWIERAEQLTDEELAVYNYLRNTEGQESADAYLDLMEETLNQRVGGKQAEDIANIENPLLGGLAAGGYGFLSGVDQFGTGVQQLFTGKALPTTATQFGAAQVRENLADAGPRLPEWMGDRSLGQAVFEGTQMLGNMLPSIAVGSMAGGAGISANIAKAIGSGVMGASAGGNAYNEAVKQGYSTEQARSYGTLVALSEGGLSYLLGGISALGGRVSGNVISKTVQNIDNALLRAGAELGLNMLSEGAEEYLQEFLTPVFRNIALDENNPVELVSEEAIYSAIMGALSAGVLEGPGRIGDAVTSARSGGTRSGPRRATEPQQTAAEFTAQAEPETAAAGSAGPAGENGGAMLTAEDVSRILSQIEQASTEQGQNSTAASTGETAAPRGDVRELTLPGGEEIPISQRTWQDASNRKVNAFQYDHPELRPYYQSAARALLSDLSSAVRGERFPTYDQDGYVTGYTGVKRSVSEPIEQALDNANLSYAQIQKAAEDLIADNGQENYAAAKKLELFLDQMLSEGYTDAEGRFIPADEAYIALRDGQTIDGGEYRMSEEEWNSIMGQEPTGLPAIDSDLGTSPVLERVQQDGGDGIRRVAVFDTGVEAPQGDVRELTLPGGDSGVVRMSLDEYLGRQGLSAPISDYMDDKLRLPHGETQRQRARREADANAAADDYAARRQAAIQEYNQKVQAGEITPKSRIERLIETARGHDDNESVQAARRALEKRGIDWRVDEDGGPLYDKGPESSVGAARSGFDPYTGLINRYGAIEPGENPARVVDAPKKTAPNNKVALSARTVMEAAVTPEAMLPDLAQMIVDGRFSRIPVSNRQKVTAAENRIRQVGYENALRSWREDIHSGKVSDDIMAMGAVLYNAAANAGDTRLALDIFYDYSQASTQGARATQANRILKTLTPSGQLYMVQKMVNDVNNAVYGSRENRPGDVPVELWMQRVGESLADELSSRLNVKPREAKTVAQTILSDLRRYANETAPRRQTSRDTRTEMDRIMDLFQNRTAYEEAWQAAKDTLSDTFENNPDALSAFDAWLDSSLEYTRRLTKELTQQDQIVLPEELADRFLKAETDEARDAVLDEINQYVADRIPSTFMDKFNALRYLNMLGNLKTQVRNVGGNVIMKGVRAQRVKLQAAMENLAERSARAKGAEFERTVSLTRDREIFKLAKEEFDRSAEALMGERKYSYNGQSIPADIQNRRTIFKVNGEWGLDGKGPASLLRKGADALMGGLESYRRLTNWAMEEGDVFFARSIYADALSRYLKANGVTAEQYRSGQVDEGLLDRARQRAVKEAQEATFRDSNAFSDMIAKIGFRNPKNGIEKAANMAVQGVLPFRRTPANVGVRAVEYSPLGIIGTAVKAAKAAGGNKSVTSTDVIASLSKTLTGTGLFALGAALGMGGMLSGLGAGDENEKELESQEGRQAYALYLPDWLTGAVGLPQGFNLTLDWASPAAIPLFMGAELGNQAAENGVQGKDIFSALASSSNVLLNMSMLQGINDQLENISYSENPLVDLTLNSLTDFWTAGLTSTLGGQIERTLEDVRMSTYTDENSELPTDLQYELGSQLARVPGVDYQQIPFVDGWGRTESSGHWLPRAGNQFLNPSYTSSDISTPAIQETRRIYEATGDGGVVSKRPDKEITVDSQTKYLSAGEYLQYATERGEMREKLVTDIIGRDAYQDMGAAEQAEVIKDVYSYTDEVAKSHISEYEPSNWVKKVEAYGVDPADAILYRAAKDALEDADVEGVTSELRSMLMEDTSLTSGEKAAIDKAILSEKSKVDYSSQESFLISQMSDAAQSKWPGIRDRFGLSAEEYQEAVRIYNMDKDDGVTTADKKRMLREMFGWEGNAIYKALGKKADSDEED